VGIPPKRFLREERLASATELAVGHTVTVGAFSKGDLVDVVGTIKGRGFAGTIKRHGFQRGPASHGCMNVRQPGSIGMKRTGKVSPGKRMSGHYGDSRQTTKNLEIVEVDAGRNLLLVKGSIPGPNGGFVQVRTAKTGVKKKGS
jgi:large subunit ribosomal protein L3